MNARPRWFGRGQHSGFREKSVDVILGLLYSGGWPGVITHALGLQGELRIEEHVFHIRRANPKAPPLRLVYASDFHCGPTLNRRLLEHVMRAIRGAGSEVAKNRARLFFGSYRSRQSTCVFQYVSRRARC